MSLLHSFWFQFVSWLICSNSIYKPTYIWANKCGWMNTKKRIPTVMRKNWHDLTDSQVQGVTSMFYVWLLLNVNEPTLNCFFIHIHRILFLSACPFSVQHNLLNFKQRTKFQWTLHKCDTETIDCEIVWNCQWAQTKKNISRNPITIHQQ